MMSHSFSNIVVISWIDIFLRLSSRSWKHNETGACQTNRFGIKHEIVMLGE